ncbi:MAG: hypothetical protein GX279_07430 [Clostridiaceae bacterium]|nr:hypothetical protein [Clostridiaceae bacterium]
MRRLSSLLIVPVFLLFISGCAAELDDNIPQGQNYGDNAAGAGNAVLPRAGAVGTGEADLQYERGREDYPGQNYAALIGAGDNTADGGAAGNTGTRLSTGDGNQSDVGGLVLRSIKSPVRQGETGALSVRGKPDTEYTITGVYRISDNMLTSTVVKRSGNNGIVELEWNVSRQTAPGTYAIMVSGGGEQMTASYTVIE